MRLALIYSILFAIAAAMAVFWRRKTEQTVAMACFACIVILYICGLGGWLPAGVYGCIGLAGISLLYLIWRGVKDRTAWLTHLITPGLLACGLVGVWVWLAHRNRLLSAWDEFSHWGLVVKNMVYFDRFGNSPDATTYFKGYPPGTALFQYLWCKLYGSFQDAYLIRATNVLSFSLLLPLFAKLNWKRCWAFVPLFFVMMCLPLTFFSGFYTELYVDALLGLLFAYILYSYFSADTMDSFLVANLALAGFVLTLTKAAGAGMALMAYLIIGMDWWRRRRHPEPTGRWKGRFGFVCLPASLLAAKMSWDWYLKVTHTSQPWAGMKQLTWPAVWEFLRGQAPDYRYTVLKNFIMAAWERPLQPYILPMNLIMWVLLLAAIAFLLLWLVKDKAQRRRLGVAAAGLFGGGVLYTTSLLILYLFTYTQYEAIRLASYERYMGTYLLGALVFLVFMTLQYALQQAEGRQVVHAMAAVMAGMLLFTNLRPCAQVTIRRGASIQKTAQLRAPFASLYTFCQSLACDTDRLYVVCQQSDGKEYWIARYTATPIQINEGCWSLGTPYGEQDIWTRPIPCSEWQKQLKAYTYVYLHLVDDQFRREYAADLEQPETIRAGALYRVINQGEQVLLRPVEQDP